MKTLLLILSITFLACGKTLERPTNQAEYHLSFNQSMESSFYNFKMKDINGKEVDFSEFKGKKLLLVNVASKCGYTKQYAQLQELYATHGDKILILGFPANNFGGQEPGSNEEIKAFCDAEFGVTFPLFEKISVKGFDKHPLYRWLSDASQNGWNNEEPSWNFCKYFVNEKGELVKFFPSSVTPLDEEILELIEA
ncbi:glutathione peroxidase [Algoriphagus boritolerans]|uniref:Glutathione peroxidase n=1 Tax=Algoriphagus boritolerans DSM 17298 = JCM 18970 TaxID=1120964 RepID=A0A1H5Y1X4_9BACT|nr:glutathione peroxidase [Algoriphagus boritolerans]SEG17600.1 glutathione peroxidase [Algoriphagus boritolerans DSM 17298 = JCM 18970]